MSVVLARLLHRGILVRMGSEMNESLSLHAVVPVMVAAALPSPVHPEEGTLLQRHTHV